MRFLLALMVIVPITALHAGETKAGLKFTFPQKWSVTTSKFKGPTLWLLEKAEGDQPMIFAKILGKGDQEHLDALEKDGGTLHEIFPYGRKWKSTKSKEKIDGGFLMIGVSAIGDFERHSFVMVRTIGTDKVIFYGEKCFKKELREEMQEICKSCKIEEKK